MTNDRNPLSLGNISVHRSSSNEILDFRMTSYENLKVDKKYPQGDREFAPCGYFISATTQQEHHCASITPNSLTAYSVNTFLIIPALSSLGSEKRASYTG